MKDKTCTWINSCGECCRRETEVYAGSEGMAGAAKDDGNRIRIKSGLKQLDKARIEEMAAKEALVERRKR